MNVQDPWSPFQEVLTDPWEHARSWKGKSGAKVVGHLLPDVPEEIIHASGALAVAIEGASVQVSRAQTHMPAYTCNHAMGAFDLKLRGNLDMLDSMIVPYVCDTTRNLFHLWNHCFPDMHNEFLRLPKRVLHPEAATYLRAEFARLYESMCRLTGIEPSYERLAESLRLYNRSRARLRQAYQRHVESPSTWTAAKVHAVLASAMRTTREEHLAWMDALPWADEGSASSQDRIRLYVRGKTWDPPGILQMLDRLGFTIARDETVTGFRSIEQDADVSLEPLDALVRRHVTTIPYTGYHQEPVRIVQGFVERVQACSAQGVLFLNPKFCEAAAFDTPDQQKALEEAKVPSLVLETAARGVSPQQARLRLEAFREMISADLDLS
jgi:benzoyl-CoA reductase subunit C